MSLFVRNLYFLYFVKYFSFFWKKIYNTFFLFELINYFPILISSKYFVQIELFLILLIYQTFTSIEYFFIEIFCINEILKILKKILKIANYGIIPILTILI